MPLRRMLSPAPLSMLNNKSNAFRCSVSESRLMVTARWNASEVPNPSIVWYVWPKLTLMETACRLSNVPATAIPDPQPRINTAKGRTCMIFRWIYPWSHRTTGRRRVYLNPNQNPCLPSSIHPISDLQHLVVFAPQNYRPHIEPITCFPFVASPAYSSSLGSHSPRHAQLSGNFPSAVGRFCGECGEHFGEHGWLDGLLTGNPVPPVACFFSLANILGAGLGAAPFLRAVTADVAQTRGAGSLVWGWSKETGWRERKGSDQ